MAARGAAWQQVTVAANGNKIPDKTALMAVFADNYFLAATPDGEPFVVEQSVPGVMIPLEGKINLKDRLAADMFDLTAQPASTDALNAVISMIRGQAAHSQRVKPNLRTARLSDGRIALDLGRHDGALVLCSPYGWTISERGGEALFRHSPMIMELPFPVHGGSAAAAFELINLRGDNAMAVYAACRLVGCMPGVTLPVEIFFGQPGTAKTGTTSMTVGWLGGRIVPMPKDPRDWAAMASRAHCVGHDNVSSLSAERSDLICKAASGDSWAARALYTDSDIAAVNFEPVSIVMNTVEMSLRGDLLRRAAVHELIPPWRYIGDAERAAMWEQAHAGALGWLLDRLCQVLAMLPNIEPPAGETMPDFARVLLACDALWRTQALGAWKLGQGSGYADQLDDEVVSWYITERITQPWEGSARDLMHKLALPLLAGREWTPRLVSSRLDRCTAALVANGWTVQRPLDGHTKRRKILLFPPGYGLIQRGGME